MCELQGRFSIGDREMIRALFIATALLSLGACGSEPSDGVGGVSASEASALNDAAAMLDAQRGVAQSGDAGLNPAASAAAGADRGRVAPQPDPQP
ncbi:putative lipoprotein [Sphingobium sp. RAC03]|nr:putative lipoprotein [Sphingobium sp. RAC03]